MSDTKLDNILSKVRGLVAKAEHPDTPAAEADLCRERADQLMLKYAIDQATLRDSQPAATRMTPSKMEVEVCEAGSAYENMFIMLLSIVCEHTRTKPVFYGSHMEAGLLASLKSIGREPKVRARVYGFEGDLRYFEILYTTLLLHMSNGIDPKPDHSLSDQVNSYNLHMAGLNWLEIASLYYRRGHEYGWNGDKSDYMRYGSYWKRAYRREAKLRDETAVKLPANFTAQKRIEWRKNFAQSYISTLQFRLWQARENRPTGGELILSSAMADIEAMINDEHKNLTEMSSLTEDVKFNEQAWNAGDRHAQSADLSAHSNVGQAERKAL
jgi:hypothetical protein